MRRDGMTTAVVIDQYLLWLDAIERLTQEAGVTVVGTTTRSQEAAALLEQHQPDIFILGLERNESSTDLVQRLVRAAAQVGAVALVVSTDSDPEFAEQCLADGAYAYVLKTVQPTDLSSAIRQATERSVFLFARPAVPGMLRAAKYHRTAPTITPRELDVLRLVAEGLPNADVARRLWISEATVKFHLSRTYEKLGVSNRTGAVRWALREGLFSTDERLTA
jgi:DNA-binding NarL/FixJ family response regulator